MLFASECGPYIKTGGLADVIALPKSLRGMGEDIRVVLPKYRGIPEDYRERMTHVGETRVRVGWREQYCGIESLVEDGVTIYFIDNEYYYGATAFTATWTMANAFVLQPRRPGDIAGYRLSAGRASLP